jgi:predicted acyltransferase
LLISVVILIGYCLILGYLPFADGTLPTFNRASNNWTNSIDLKILGKHMWQADYDPEGLFSTIPSIVTCVSGVLVGRTLGHLKKIKQFFLIAFILLVSGYVFSIWFPINKSIWSKSFGYKWLWNLNFSFYLLSARCK